MCWVLGGEKQIDAKKNVKLGIKWEKACLKGSWLNVRYKKEERGKWRDG